MKRRTPRAASLLTAFVLFFSVENGVAASYDLIIRGGTLYDGRGGKPIIGDIALQGDRIAAVGNLGAATASREIDARGLAVAPGFIDGHSDRKSVV